MAKLTQNEMVFWAALILLFLAAIFPIIQIPVIIIALGIVLYYIYKMNEKK